MPGPRHAEAGRDRRRRVAAEYAGWIAVAAGVVLCALGWYGVSGERFAERQIPFLASSTIPGAALIVAGAVLLAAWERDGATAARVEELHRLLVSAEPPGGDPAGTARPGTARADTGEAAGAGAVDAAEDGLGEAAPATDAKRLAVPHGSVHHRPDCPLVEGKPEAREVDGETIQNRGLRPCPVCTRPSDDTRDTGDTGGTDSTGATGGGADQRDTGRRRDDGPQEAG